MTKYSIVIPVYNSEQSLVELYTRIKKVFDENKKICFELLLVDDSSRDNSFAIIEELHFMDSRVKAIQLSKNCGQHAALLCGFHYSTGDFIITMDDDLQHPPEEIPKLIQFMDTHEEIDVVIGKYISKKHGIIRNIGTSLSNIVSSYIFRKRKDLSLTSFRLMRKSIVTELCCLKINVPRIGNMLLQITNHIDNVIVEHDQRQYGKSGYRFFRLLNDFINNIITNSAFPLIIVRNIGIGSFILSFILGLYYFIRYLVSNISIQGWTTIILLILLYAGLILLAIGIIGDYLIRILDEAKKIPNYFVRKELLKDDINDQN